MDNGVIAPRENLAGSREGKGGRGGADATSGSGCPLWAGALLLVVILALSAALKLRSAIVIDEAGIFRAQAERFLQVQGYTLAEGQGSGGRISGIAGGCSITLLQSRLQGWDRTALRHVGSAAEEYFVVFGGRVYDEQPVWLTKAYHYWDRLRRELGFSVRPRLLVAVAARSGCGPRGMPWPDFEP